MPALDYSRHLFVRTLADDDAKLYLAPRIPFRFQLFADTRQHSVVEGDTLWNLAGAYFASFPRPSGLWWVIADYQPEPIFDPTLTLAVGQLLYIPSTRTVTEYIFNPKRRQDDDQA